MIHCGEPPTLALLHAFTYVSLSDSDSAVQLIECGHGTEQEHHVVVENHINTYARREESKQGKYQNSFLRERESERQRERERERERERAKERERKRTTERVE